MTEISTFAIGDIVEQKLVTDTIAYEVIAATDVTITLRRCIRTGNILQRSHHDSPWPIVYDEVRPLSADEAQRFGDKGRRYRRRKDGTFRMGNGFPPVRHVHRIDGQPVEITDYRY